MKYNGVNSEILDDFRDDLAVIYHEKAKTLFWISFFSMVFGIYLLLQEQGGPLIIVDDYYSLYGGIVSLISFIFCLIGLRFEVLNILKRKDTSGRLIVVYGTLTLLVGFLSMIALNANLWRLNSFQNIIIF